MGELKEQINSDVKTAMKAGEKDTLTTLRGLSAAIKQIEVDTREELSDEKITEVIQKEIKKRRDTIKFAKEGGRDDMVADNEKEIACLQAYLGKQLSEDELRAIIEKCVADGADNIGKVMGHLNKEHKGEFEGAVASGIAKEVLG